MSDTIPVLLDIAPDVYDLQFIPNLTPEESVDVAELANSAGWKIVLRYLTAEIRSHEVALSDPMLTDAQKLHFLTRWNVARQMFKSLRYIPLQKQAEIAEMREQDKVAPAPQSSAHRMHLMPRNIS